MCLSQLGQNVKRVNCVLILQFLPKSFGICLLISTSSTASGDIGQTMGSNLCFGAAPGAGKPSPRPVITERYDEPREPQIPLRLQTLWRHAAKKRKQCCALEPLFIIMSIKSSQVSGVLIELLIYGRGITVSVLVSYLHGSVHTVRRQIRLSEQM